MWKGEKRLLNLSYNHIWSIQPLDYVIFSCQLRTSSRCHLYLEHPRGTTYWTAIFWPQGITWGNARSLTYASQDGHLYDVIALGNSVSSCTTLISFLLEEMKLARLSLSLLWPFSCSHLLAKAMQVLCDNQSNIRVSFGTPDPLCFMQVSLSSKNLSHWGSSGSKLLSLSEKRLHYNSTIASNLCLWQDKWGILHL